MRVPRPVTLAPEMRGRTTQNLVSSNGADVYRWTDARGEVHYSNVPDDAPAGAVVERLPDGAAPPGAAGVRENPVPGAAAAGQAGGGETAAVAPASLDLERFQLERQYREAKSRLAAIDEKLRALAAADAAAPEAGEDAVVDLEKRSAEEIALQSERDDATKQIDGIRARYADLARHARQARGGEIPVGWPQDLD